MLRIKDEGEGNSDIIISVLHNYGYEDLTVASDF